MTRMGVVKRVLSTRAEIGNLTKIGRENRQRMVLRSTRKVGPEIRGDAGVFTNGPENPCLHG